MEYAAFVVTLTPPPLNKSKIHPAACRKRIKILEAHIYERVPTLCEQEIGWEMGMVEGP